MIRCSSTAVGLLRRAEQAARRFDPSARVRLVPDGTGVRFELAGEPAPGDEVVQHEGGFTLFVAPAIRKALGQSSGLTAPIVRMKTATPLKGAGDRRAYLRV